MAFRRSSVRSRSAPPFFFETPFRRKMPRHSQRRSRAAHLHASPTIHDQDLTFGCSRASRAASKGPVSEPRDFRSLVWSDRNLEAKPSQEYFDELGRSSGRVRESPTAERFLSGVCGLLKTDTQRLAGRNKDRETAELRRLVAALGVERWRQRCKDLAEVLGKNPDVVSYWVAEGVRRRADDPAFAERFDECDERLGNLSRHEGETAGRS